MIDDLIPHPFASILFALVVGALSSGPGSRRTDPRSVWLMSGPQSSPKSHKRHGYLSKSNLYHSGAKPIRPKPTKKIYYRVVVPDSGTLEAGDVVIKLNGRVPSNADAQCQDKQGKNWPCGAAAKTALRRLVRARAVVCDLPGPGEQKSLTARCAVSGTDLSTWLVRQGWAKPNHQPQPALADAAEAAKSERIGLGRNRLWFDEPLTKTSCL